MRQFLSGTDATEFNPGDPTEILRSIHILNPFVIRGKSRDVQLTRVFTVKKLEPGEGGAGGPEGPMFDLNSSPQPITLNADQDGDVTLSSADKATITCHISGSQVTYDRPNNAGESIAPSNDSNFTIDMGGKNLPTADFVDAAGNVTSISSANVTVDFTAKTVTFANSGVDRLVLNVDQSAGSDGQATVTTASREISSGTTWVSCTVNFKVFVNRNGTVIPSGAGFHLPVHIVKNIPVPTPTVHLTNEVISVPTTHFGTNPDDDQFFGTNVDFANGLETTLTVRAGDNILSWHGDADTATPSNPPIGSFRINPIGITGNTDNGVVLTAQDHAASPSLDGGATSTDKDYRIEFKNQESPPGTVLRLSFSASGGGVKIDMSSLGEFDNSETNYEDNGSQRFDSIFLNIPVMVNVSGTTTVVNKSLTIQKNKSGAAPKSLSLSLDSSTVTRGSRNVNSLSPGTVNLTIVHQNMDSNIQVSGMSATGADGTNLTSNLSGMSQSVSGNTVTTTRVYTPTTSPLINTNHYPITVTATHEGLTDSKTISLVTLPATTSTQKVKFRVTIDNTHTTITTDTLTHEFTRLNLASGITPTALGQAIATTTEYRGSVSMPKIDEEELTTTGETALFIKNRPFHEATLSMLVPAVSNSVGRIINVSGTATYFGFSSSLPTAGSQVAANLGSKWFLYRSLSPMTTGDQQLAFVTQLVQSSETLEYPSSSGTFYTPFPGVATGGFTSETRDISTPPGYTGLLGGIPENHFISFALVIVNPNFGKSNNGNNIATGTIDVDLDVTYEV